MCLFTDCMNVYLGNFLKIDQKLTIIINSNEKYLLKLISIYSKVSVMQDTRLVYKIHLFSYVQEYLILLNFTLLGFVDSVFFTN